MPPLDLTAVEPDNDGAPRPATRPALPSVGGVRKKLTPKELAHCANEGVPEDLKGRHNAMVAVARRMRDDGAPAEQIRAKLEEIAPAGKEGEIAGIVDWVMQFPTRQQKADDGRKLVQSILAERDLDGKRKRITGLLDDANHMTNIAIFADSRPTEMSSLGISISSVRGLKDAWKSFERNVKLKIAERAKAIQQHNQDAERESKTKGAIDHLAKVHDQLPNTPPTVLRVPDGYTLSPTSLSRATDDGGSVQIAAAAIIIAERQIDILNGKETLTLEFSRDGQLKRVDADRSLVFNSREIIKLADTGFPVNSYNAGDLVMYLTQFEEVNIGAIPVVKVSSCQGPLGSNWVEGFLLGTRHLTKTQLVPAISDQQVLQAVRYRGMDEGDAQLIAAYHTRGTLEGWRDAVALARTFPRVMFCVYASLGTPFLEVLGTSNFAIDISFVTSSGKTTTIRIAASCWGNPDERSAHSIVNSWDASRVYLERAPAICNGLPLILDETQRARDHKVLAQTVYDVINGRGRGRGSVKGIQRSSHWHTILFSTGESRLTSFTNDGGTRSRVLSLWGPQFGKMDGETGLTVNRLNVEVRAHYGHAGAKIVQHILDHQDQWDRWREEYEGYKRAYHVKAGENAVAGRYADYLALVEFAGRLAHQVLELPWTYENPVDKLWNELLAGAEDADQAAVALEYVYSWASSRRSQFNAGASAREGDEIRECLGRWDDGNWPWIGIFPSAVAKALTDAGFEPKTTLEIWRDRGWLETSTESRLGKEINRTTKSVKTVNGVDRLVCITKKAIEGLTGPTEPGVPRKPALPVIAALGATAAEEE